MHRRSYYPQNQQLISQATGTSSGLASSRPVTPAGDMKESVSVHNDFRLDPSNIRAHGVEPDLPGPGINELSMKEKEKLFR